MNERIKELAEQCRIETYGVNGELLAADFDEQKFAELIVRECIKEITDQMFYEGIDGSNNPGYYKAINRVKEHFGVEE